MGLEVKMSRSHIVEYTDLTNIETIMAVIGLLAKDYNCPQIMDGQREQDSRNQRKVHKVERTQEGKLIANPRNRNSNY